MYRTSTGTRTLTGAEATLFREGLCGVAAMVETTRDGEPSGVGVTVFDGLSRGQKLAMLGTVGRALLLPDEPAPELSAVVEGTVAAVFQFIADAMQAEIDLPDTAGCPSWRDLVLDAGQEQDFDELPARACSDMPEWELLMECLSNTIFFDADWEGVDDYLDGDVETNRHVKAVLGIDDDYFVAAPLEPTEAELARIVSSLRSLIR